ncbi:Gfo/Idh/MocA family protein [Cohnella sp. GCM10027633]|uniref:Gfo/Idh/MocA family protein n=1 Tax=unclassified Cohnella TaxID=2636738 RepID=UPI003637BA85
MDKLTAAVVGGGQGGRLSLSALAASDLFELKAVADLRPEVREELQREFPGIATYADHRAMFAECPTDVVCVSTYPPSHEEVTMDALAMPQLKGLLVEKPLGHTAASGRRILEAIKERKLPVSVPHGLIAKATPLEIIKRVKRGDIGELKLVEIQNDKWDIINAGIHWLQFSMSLMQDDPLDWVMAQCDSSTRTYRDGMQVETAAITYAQTRGGVRIVMNTGDDVLVNREGKDTLFRLVGTRGTIEFWGWENGYALQSRDWRDEGLIVPEEYPVTGHRRHLENMASDIESGAPDYRVADSSLAALQIVEGAYLSARERCRVTFPVDRFQPPSEGRDWVAGIPYDGVGGGRNGRLL